MDTQHAGNAATKLIETLAQPTKAGPKTTPTSVLKFDFRFNPFDEPVLVGMVAAAREFCAAMKRQDRPYWLTYCGASGTGKTHLAKGINAYFQKHIYGRQFVFEPDVIRCQYGGWWPWSKIVNHMRDGKYGSFEGMCEDWFCMIDDVGSERDPTKFATDKLLEILNQRRDKWTVITSNLFLDDIGEKMDVRISSRLLRDGSKVIQNNVKDYNLR